MSETTFEKIRREVEEIGALPTLPEVPAKVLQLVADDKSSMADISKIVERDPALTANILKVANSAYYGASQRVASLQLALTMLGLNEIINIVTSISIVRMFTPRRRTGSFDRGKFWRHSFGCASASQMLARDLHFETEGVEFVAGLLHDLGKLIIDQYFHVKLKEIRNAREKEDVTMLEAESLVMGVDHAMLASWLAERWNLPSILLEAITYHHRPLDVLSLTTPSDEPALTAIVHLADILSHNPDLGFTESIQASESFGENLAWKIILAERPDLEKEQVEQYITKYENHRERVNALVEAVS